MGAAIVGTVGYREEFPRNTLFMCPLRLSACAWNNDAKSARSSSPSVIKPLITKIEATLIIRQLGALGADDQNRCDRLLRRLSGRADRPPPNIVFAKCIHGLRGDADSVEDTDVCESSSRAELVYRRLADAKPARDIANGE